MEKELTISFPGSSIGNSDFYKEQTESTEKEEAYPADRRDYHCGTAACR